MLRSAISAALVMALIFLPTLGSVLGKRGGEADEDSALARLNAQEGGQPTELPGLTGLYARMISALAKRPGMVALGTVAVVFSVIFAFVAQSGGAFGGPKRTEFFIDAESIE